MSRVMSNDLTLVSEACVPFPTPNFRYEGPGAHDMRQLKWVCQVLDQLSPAELYRMAEWFMHEKPALAQQVLALIQHDRRRGL